ncbi:pyrroline-5-carboxylate reductase (plasmid) [Rhizobium leguminosarum bv. trifolii CB782]|uniref:Pyrroline-5-carboxylate reductase n=1 Tax=Rhizobium hidalgonense TaxID=1538159 RepID=A0A2A6K6X5_9HYPH|nr:pyrroline-5-carboxylate reductase dimerization domain-containing protein [Rhizobium hidalgonense]AHG49446.1 pyrroline-5-carboxylate reductase [Rhizobium leguminosarum bv. trifolii CB782]EJC75536.1 pyrroline-5-carboxylate reductase [Rhizobium leguminosarum bv. trifolii WSM2012]MDR9773193.1 pyrroline-5-carboxylate reductase dimerization domain-containing protein [Rhizobium hidalgonense]MDR9810511.1 pyrroline-5-carboxylate reductase dimerization domain-containing protein [Rhizobium hidalgonense
MSVSLRIGIIGGGGWLGGAIAGSILDAGLVDARNLSLSYRSERPTHFPNSFWTTDNQALADRSDLILLSVRPTDWHPLAVDAKGKLVISIMAGIRLTALSSRHKTARIVRALPNAAAEVSKSYTPWIGTNEITEEDRAIVRAIFSTCGSEDEVARESDIDYLTGLSGSGPAFPALLAAAMMRDAVAHGLPAEIARRAVSTVISGAGRLLERHDESPDHIVRAFLDYRGTTAAAIEGMRAAGFDASVAKGLSAAFERSVSMGKAS